MTLCFFVSDIHGNVERYDTLVREVAKEKPHVLFLGGDLFSFHFGSNALLQKFLSLKEQLHRDYPIVLLILGNDDPKSEEQHILMGERLGLWRYINCKKFSLGEYQVYGYSYVPPTPFLLKDWERFDVSQYVDVGAVSPLEGRRTVQAEEQELLRSTIQNDLEKLTQDTDLSKTVFLFHAPPYNTNLDRANLDGKTFEHTPLDVHVGSIAIKNFIETRQPYLTLHGHVHESSSLTGQWNEKIGSTYVFSAAYDGAELAIVKFFLEQPSLATRILK